VFLVHGIWSSLATWDGFGALAGTDPRFYIQRADYSWINDRGFSATAPVVYDQLKVYLNCFKQDNNVAAVQADVVSHSMGGPVVRTMALPPTYLNDPLFPTFGAGPIRKLITIAGVHQGTPLADYLVHEPCVENLFNSWPLNKNPYNGAIQQTMAIAIRALTSGRLLLQQSLDSWCAHQDSVMEQLARTAKRLAQTEVDMKALSRW
jgi:pimeloyl-ACP methyl ester carboxylesterase